MAGENVEMKLSRESSEKASMVENVAFIDNNGIPMTRITCSAAELIPTRSYANVSVGPIQVQRYVFATENDDIMNEIRATQALCEAAVAEERQTVHALIRQSEGGRVTE